MTGSAVQKASALALLVTLLFALPATAKLMVPRDFHGVTVIINGGWELPGMTVRWSDDDGGLWVYRPDGARRLYQPSELAALQDANGRDMTREVIPPSALSSLSVAPPRQKPPAYQPPSQPPAQVADEIGGSTAAARPAKKSTDWRFLLGVEGGWGKPHDTDLLGSNGGLGLGVRVRLQLAGALFLAGGYDWNSVPVSSHLVAAPQDVADRTIDPIDGEDGQLRGFWAGLALLSAGDTPESARFYLEGGVGRYEVEGLPVFSTEEAFLGYHAGVGFLIPLGTAAALDLGARGTHVVNLDLGRGDDRHTLVSFRVGLSILAR